MPEPIVSAARLGKTYRLYSNPWDRLGELVTGRPRHQTVQALDDVGFEIAPGESLGIIGQNGAGKSTLLSVLAGVTSPSRGTLEVRGQVASLLELGMGFHPELTGRQNIRLNAAMMGIPESEVQRQIPEIIAFSELGPFIDRPVKIYSTGMAMRLGFAIAVQVEPDILIIDEALSVGDGYFQKKCMDRILRFVESGRTLLFCSHALYYVSAYCQRALWLQDGRIAALGPVDQVVREYESFLLERRAEALSKPARPQDVGAADEVEASDETGTADDGGRPARIVGVRQAGERNTYRHLEPWTLEIEWRTVDPQLPFHVGVGIDRIDGVQVCSFGTHRDGLPPLAGREHYTVRLHLPALPILKGDFSLYVFLLDESGLHVYDQELISAAFSVATPGYQLGLVRAEHAWHHEDWPHDRENSGGAALEIPQDAKARKTR